MVPGASSAAVTAAAFERLNDSSMCLCLQDELTTYVGRVLEQAKEKWKEGREPTREDGCYVSTVAYDIIQVKTVLIR